MNHRLPLALPLAAALAFALAGCGPDLSDVKVRRSGGGGFPTDAELRDAQQFDEERRGYERDRQDAMEGSRYP